MISPAQVVPFDETETAWLAKTEGDVDKALAADKHFSGPMVSDEWPRWVEIARRYRASGWHVQVVSGRGYPELRITHPSRMLDDRIETQEIRYEMS